MNINVHIKKHRTDFQSCSLIVQTETVLVIALQMSCLEDGTQPKGLQPEGKGATMKNMKRRLIQ